MAQTGYTPISLYYSTTASTAPTAGNLVAGELAINTNDGKLYYKDSSGVVQVIGTKGGVGSSTTTQVLYNSSGLVVGSANLTFNGTTLTTANDASISGLTVGKGGGAVASATAVGSGAMAATNTGAFNSAFGVNSLTANTSGSENTGIGWSALYTNTTGAGNSAFGKQTLYFNTAGNSNSTVGEGSLLYNTTGSFNTAVGRAALQANTTASNNTAVGYQAAYSLSTNPSLTAFGYQALYNNTGGYCEAFGHQAGKAITTGTNNIAIGRASMAGASSITGGANIGVGVGTFSSLTTGASNIGIGLNAQNSTTTGAYNTAIGDSALFTNTTGSQNTAVGYQAGYSNSTGNYNVYVGEGAGFSATGSQNTFVGDAAGKSITSGQKNSILGGFQGNQGGLDIRTSSNYIVLSDGDGNPTAYWNNSGTFNFTANAGDVAGNLYNANAGPYGLRIKFTTASPNSAGNYFQECRDGGNTLRYQLYSNGGIANYSANNSNLSDQREKKDIELAGDYLDKVCAIPVKTFLYNDQTDTDLNLGVIAQDVQAVAPELVMESNWGTEEEPKMRLSIYQTDLQYALMKAIQELKAEIDAYKATHP